MKTLEINKELKDISQLTIGDVVLLVGSDGSYLREPYNEMTVIQANDKEVKFFRPYVSLADFTYAGGVIPYIGVEQFSVPIISPCKYIVVGNIFRPSEAEKQSEQKKCECKGKFHDDKCPLRVK